MKKIAFVGAAFLGLTMTSGAMAAWTADQEEVCGTLPNSKWSWVISYDTQTSTETSDPYNAGKSGNVFVDVTTTTTSVAQCTALNPQGKVNADHSVTVDLGSTSTSESVKVGQQCDGNQHNTCN